VFSSNTACFSRNTACVQRTQRVFHGTQPVFNEHSVFSAEHSLCSTNTACFRRTQPVFNEHNVFPAERSLCTTNTSFCSACVCAPAGVGHRRAVPNLSRAGGTTTLPLISRRATREPSRTRSAGFQPAGRAASCRPHAWCRLEAATPATWKVALRSDRSERTVAHGFSREERGLSLLFKPATEARHMIQPRAPAALATTRKHKTFAFSPPQWGEGPEGG